MTSIGEEAFAYNLLTGLFIPDSVTAIEEGAFAHNYLSKLIIPSSLSQIGNYAFANNLLTSLVIPTGVTSIGEGAFYINELTSVIIPDSVTHIGEGAFAKNQAKPEDLTIIAHPQSPAKDYAVKHGHTFQATRVYTDEKSNRNVSVNKRLSVIRNESRLMRTGYIFERSQRKWQQLELLKPTK